jgi:hypothetical protein
VPAHRLGRVGGDSLEIAAAGESLHWTVREIYNDWHDEIANAVRGELTTT